MCNSQVEAQFLPGDGSGLVGRPVLNNPGNVLKLFVCRGWLSECGDQDNNDDGRRGLFVARSRMRSMHIVALSNSTKNLVS